MAKIHLSPYGAAVLQYFKDKMIEVNTGEVKTTLLFSDSTQDQKSVIRGVLKDVVGDALVVECAAGKATKVVLINCWSINSVVEVETSGNIDDIYYDTEFMRRRR